MFFNKIGKLTFWTPLVHNIAISSETFLNFYFSKSNGSKFIKCLHCGRRRLYLLKKKLFKITPSPFVPTHSWSLLSRLMDSQFFFNDICCVALAIGIFTRSADVGNIAYYRIPKQSHGGWFQLDFNKQQLNAIDDFYRL